MGGGLACLIAWRSSSATSSALVRLAPGSGALVPWLSPEGRVPSWSWPSSPIVGKDSGAVEVLGGSPRGRKISERTSTLLVSRLAMHAILVKARD